MRGDVRNLEVCPDAADEAPRSHGMAHLHVGAMPPLYGYDTFIHVGSVYKQGKQRVYVHLSSHLLSVLLHRINLMPQIRPPPSSSPSSSSRQPITKGRTETVRIRRSKGRAKKEIWYLVWFHSRKKP